MPKPKYYPAILPILPVAGEVLREMSKPLDVSYSVLYQIFRKSHKPSNAVKRRICRALVLDFDIWKLKPHQTSAVIYEAYRSQKNDLYKAYESNPDQSADADREEEEALSDIL